ncbi:MAG: dockerin type I repeat-containing protein [Oscillospiraceae bacterium]|nr:dockerin type I repeat-containing protein [Oscillospiraceae bacterium]
MRKFTKEIAALMASAAVGASVCAGAVTAAPESPETETETTTCLTKTAGEMMPEDEFPAVDGGSMTEPVGTMAAEDTTAEEWFPTEPVGTMVAEDTTEEWFPTEPIGTMMPEETLPPLAGDIAPVDGDIDADGTFDILDVIAFQKWLLGDRDVIIYNLYAADLYPDGVLDVFDMSLMKRGLVQD